jgi:RHS repeat-associated protein
LGEQRNKDGDYYAYGLKIAAISSKAYNAPNNPYQYQGDYSEFDDETGYNEFTLRNYDPQTGRFVQADPYDQFPSPYTGMGNDPVNMTDPSGGFAGMGMFNSMLAGAVGGYLVGGIAAAVTGNGDEFHKWGAIGAGAGLLAGLGSSMDFSGAGSLLKGVAPSLFSNGVNVALNVAKQKGDGGGNGGDNGYSNTTRSGKMFKDQTEAFKYMWEKSTGKTGGKDEDRENGAFITTKGVLVLPNVKNDATTTDFDVLKVRKNGSGQNTHVQFEGKWYSIKGIVHTHPHAGAGKDKWGVRAPSPEDFTQSKNLYRGLPAFVISKVETFFYSGAANTVQEVGKTADVLSGKLKLVSY